MNKLGSYHDLVYHIVWATKNRLSLLTPEMESKLFPFFNKKCIELECILHAVNGTPDHVHLLVSAPPTKTLADIVKNLKGSSSHFINKESGLGTALYWQDGYGAITIRSAEIPKVTRYLLNQKEHHTAGNLSDILERTKPVG